MFKRFSAMGVAVSFTMLVVGCGGSGGGGNSPEIAGIPATIPPDLAGRASTAVMDVAKKPARDVNGGTSSKFSGIVQSSSDGDNVVVTVDGDDRTKFEIVNGGNSGWTISSDGTGVAISDLPGVGTGLTKKVDDGTVFVDFYHGYHRQDEDDGTDYLAGGVWLRTPEGSTGAVSLGAFVSGNSPYNSDSVDGDASAPTTGGAKYKGAASGVYLDKSGKKLGYLDGSVTLTANFGTNSISGDISSIYLDSDLANGMLVLGEADFTTGGGPFVGGRMVTGTVDGVEYTGNWGGQFFGTHDVTKTGTGTTPTTTTTRYPGYVGGTFAATPDGNAEGPSFLGIILPGFYAEVP